MEDKDVLVRVEGVSKKFCKNLKRSLVYGLKDAFGAINPLAKKNTSTLRKQEFWAVKNISFELRRGECLGLIGHNGAGKSTMLKILNGLINPDEGKITIRGKVGALIELGAGFTPILSGRENIYNNGAILGFTRAEIDAKIAEIIAFSEIEAFIDSPVQNYSSGMRVRLGFAIAAHLEPDVLIIDEVLAVGDLGFVLKCFQQIDKLLPHTAVIFVSHSMPMVSRICNHIILMDHGVAEYNGRDVSKGIGLYYDKFKVNDSNVVLAHEKLVLTDFSLAQISNASFSHELTFSLRNEVNDFVITDPELYVELKDKEQRPIAGKVLSLDLKMTRVEEMVVRLSFDKLTKGKYSLDVLLSDGGTPLVRHNDAVQFTQHDGEQMWVPYEIDMKQL
ncbi:ABC transporter ATP-binding protein [Lishizhenia sp.]|uniref:ABC transporter ATP-binding protein n=1 Tax=Lishizhenia sp. TaxID=2497594 RepID=UPI00299DCF8E|nr:ABC transporter ATP-binding protein [Lishizhenia sp.]MDX1446046.1 ABC transporter ATP-binding protein [Lishizhenia sp.]